VACNHAAAIFCDDDNVFCRVTDGDGDGKVCMGMKMTLWGQGGDGK